VLFSHRPFGTIAPVPDAPGSPARDEFEAMSDAGLIALARTQGVPLPPELEAEAAGA
jgi:hypothetical protein